jgi:hypothetical protein
MEIAGLLRLIYDLDDAQALDLAARQWPFNRFTDCEPEKRTSNWRENGNSSAVDITILRIYEPNFASLGGLLILEHNARVHRDDVAGNRLCRNYLRASQLVSQSLGCFEVSDVWPGVNQG